MVYLRLLFYNYFLQRELEREKIPAWPKLAKVQKATIRNPEIEMNEEIITTATRNK